MPYLAKEMKNTFLMQSNFETKNAMIVGSIIKQVTNEGGQLLLENNGVVYLMQMKHKIWRYFLKRFFDNKCLTLMRLL